MATVLENTARTKKNPYPRTMMTSVIIDKVSAR